MIQSPFFPLDSHPLCEEMKKITQRKGWAPPIASLSRVSFTSQDNFTICTILRPGDLHPLVGASKCNPRADAWDMNIGRLTAFSQAAALR